MRHYELYEIKPNTVILRDIDTNVFVELPHNVADQMKHLLV